MWGYDRVVIVPALKAVVICLYAWVQIPLPLMIFYAPLLQFELLEKEPNCAFDLFFPFFGLTEFDDATVWLLGLLGVWQVISFYKTTVRVKENLDFKQETLMSDLITGNNFNYISVLNTLFTLIFLSNFSGLLPYTQTLTSQLLFTLILSFVILLVIWTQSFFSNKILMLNHYLPQGAPLVLISFIIIIELISQLSRVISLSVRLFANMTSGHALLKILAGFGLGTLGLVGVWEGLFIFPILIIFIITILELIIAFLQTYVFITLLLIYINEQE